MALAIFTSSAFSAASGLEVAALASVEVRKESDNTLANIFSDVNGVSPLGNPFLADAEGMFSFFAAGIARGYKVAVTKNGSTRTLRNVALGTAAEFDASDAVGAALGSATLAAFLTAIGVGSGSTPSFAQVNLGGDPASALQAATKQYVDSIAFGLDAKASVRAATTANITLSAPQTIDGVSVIANDRVLVKNQSTASQNGIYIVQAGAWTRAGDMDAWTEVPGAFVFVEEGSANADSGWLCTSNAGGTIGSTNMTWAQFSGPSIYQPLDGTLTALAGLTIAANSLSIGSGADAFSQVTFNANTFPGRSSSGSLVAKTMTDFGFSLVDDADAPTARQTLGIVEAIVVACSDETTLLTAGVNKVKFRMPYAFTLTGVRASLTTAQAAGSIFTVDINENNVSVLSTKLTIDNNELTSTTAATAAVISDSSLADDAEISVDIDQIGTAAATGLKVYLIGRKTA